MICTYCNSVNIFDELYTTCSLGRLRSYIMKRKKMFSCVRYRVRADNRTWKLRLRFGKFQIYLSYGTNSSTNACDVRIPVPASSPVVLRYCAQILMTHHAFASISLQALQLLTMLIALYSSRRRAFGRDSFYSIQVPGGICQRFKGVNLISDIN